MANKQQASSLAPSPNFNSINLPCFSYKPGTIFYRLNGASYSTALYFDRSGDGRFDGVTQPYGILYLGQEIAGAFIESFGRSPSINALGIKAVAEADLRNRDLWEIQVQEPLKLVKLYGDGLAKMGAESSVTSGTDYNLSRQWGTAIYQHPRKVDGIVYFSRHDNQQLCMGLFDQCLGKLNESNCGNLVDFQGGRILAKILAKYDYVLL